MGPTDVEGLIAQICALSGADPEQVREMVERAMEAARERAQVLQELSSRTPLTGDQADDYLTSALSMMYCSPRALTQ